MQVIQEYVNEGTAHRARVVSELRNYGYVFDVNGERKEYEKLIRSPWFVVTINSYDMTRHQIDELHQRLQDLGLRYSGDFERYDEALVLAQRISAEYASVGVLFYDRFSDKVTLYAMVRERRDS